MKQRFPPALEKYEANTAKGLCAYCGKPLDPVSFHITVDGVQYRLHDSCRQALLVAQRLNGNKVEEVGSLTTSASFKGVAFKGFERQFLAESENLIIANFFKRKQREAL